MKKPEIVVCVCSLGLYKKDNIISLFNIIPKLSGGILITECSLLPMSRNYTIRHALRIHPDLTHILFVDDDMCNFDTWHIEKLVEQDKDIISAFMTMRNPPYAVVSAFEDNTKIIEYLNNKETVGVHHTGMAFTLIKREVIDALAEQTSEGPIWFTMDRPPRNSFNDEIEEFVNTNLNRPNKNIENLVRDAIAFGQTSNLGSDIIGEDIQFCHKARMLDFKVYVNCEVIIGHLGNVAHDINTQIEYKQIQSIKKGEKVLVDV